MQFIIVVLIYLNGGAKSASESAACCMETNEVFSFEKSSSLACTLQSSIAKTICIQQELMIKRLDSSHKEEVWAILDVEQNKD